MQLRTTKKAIRGSAEVAPVFHAIIDAEGELDRMKEHFWACFLDTKNHILRIELVTLGLLDQTVVHPREVFRPAIGCAAKTVILCHNHPSGDPEPSDKDVILTRRLIEAGQLLDVHVLDHVIIGEGAEYWSMQEHNDQHGLCFN